MEVIRQGVPDHGAVHSECSWCSDNRMSTQQWTSDVVAPPSIVVWLTWDAAYRQHLWPVCNNLRGTVQPCHADICAWWSRVYTLLNLPHPASLTTWCDRVVFVLLIHITYTYTDILSTWNIYKTVAKIWNEKKYINIWRLAACILFSKNRVILASAAFSQYTCVIDRRQTQMADDRRHIIAITFNVFRFYDVYLCFSSIFRLDRFKTGNIIQQIKRINFYKVVCELNFHMLILHYISKLYLL